MKQPGGPRESSALAGGRLLGCACAWSLSGQTGVDGRGLTPGKIHQNRFIRSILNKIETGIQVSHKLQNILNKTQEKPRTNVCAKIQSVSLTSLSVKTTWKRLWQNNKQNHQRPQEIGRRSPPAALLAGFNKKGAITLMFCVPHEHCSSVPQSHLGPILCQRT